MELPAGERLPLQVGDRRLHLRVVDRRRLHDDRRRILPAGEGGLEPVVRLHGREILRERLGARHDRLHPERGEREGDENRRRTDHGDERVGEDTVEDPAPGPAALRPLEPVEEGHAHLVDPVTEPREERRQDGERAEHGDRHDEDGRHRERAERLVAREEHAGHRGHHRQAGDQDRASRGGGGSLESRALALARRALFALALQVEHRVVDADRQPDQQHDRADVLVHGPDLARDREQAHRRHHGREGEQQRDACGDERAEGDDEDHDRDRQREETRPLEVLVELLVELLLGADAELLDPKASDWPLRRRRPRPSPAGSGRSRCPRHPGCRGSRSPSGRRPRSGRGFRRRRGSARWSRRRRP